MDLGKYSTIDEYVKNFDLPKYRIRQFNRAVYKDLISKLDELTTWPAKDRINLKHEIRLETLELVKSLKSRDGSTEKSVFKICGKMFETVLMKHSDGRNSLCVSSMIGCPVGCTFCATGRSGFYGNLTFEHITEQVLYFARLLKAENKKLTNIVFMGMGEPLLNIDNVLASIDIITDPDRFGFSPSRITISTSGIISGINKLIDLGFKGRLAISLHAPQQSLREKLMPIARTNKLNDLMDVVDKYIEKTNKRITFEYILIDKVNDHSEQAVQLSRLLSKRLSHVNLIPYNSVPGLTYRKSDRNRIHNFSRTLSNYGIDNTIRVTMGDDIKAACGQLASDNIHL